MTKRGLSNEERFWVKVDRSGGPDSCWLWTAGKFRQGYGTYHDKLADGAWVTRPAHRVAYVFVNGPIPDDLDVCHTCDNPPCCNPAHLFLGTHLDNMHDRDAKGRANHVHGDAHPFRAHPELCLRGDDHWSRAHPERLARGDQHGAHTCPEAMPRGERHGMARLTTEGVQDIRTRYAAGTTLLELATRYGVSTSTIHDAITRKTWKHVA